MPIKKNHDPSVAQWVKKVREQTGLSQQSFWKLLNIPSSTGCRYETGSRTVPETVKQLIEYRILGTARPRLEQKFTPELLVALDMVRGNEMAWAYIKQLVEKETTKVKKGE